MAVMEPIWFDTHLTFERHISDVCKNSFYHLFNIRHSKTFDSGKC